MNAYARLAKFNLFLLVICMIAYGSAQSPKATTATQEVRQRDLMAEKASLLTELQFLEKEALKFNDSLAIAYAKVEIADAAWQLDRDWAKKLLREAYAQAVAEASQNQKQNRAAGVMPSQPDAAHRSWQKVRRRALEVARGDKDFVRELVESEGERLGAYEKQLAFAGLADQSLMSGDISASAHYILQGIKADPTQGAAPSLINIIASHDRALADRLIVQYIAELQKFPINSSDQSDRRIFLFINSLVNPYLPYDPSSGGEPVKVAPPGPQAMRACFIYVLEALDRLEQREPGYLLRRRGILLSLWIPLQQYAPELISAFMNLESRSRRPGEKLTLPTPSGVEEQKRSKYERQIKDNLSSDQPDEAAIYTTISRDDFDKARKMIGKLQDQAKKKQFFEMVNSREVISIATKGDVYGAETLAGNLNNAVSIAEVYPLLIAKCIARKDQPCADRLVYQALKQMKNADTSPLPIPEGIPASLVQSDLKPDLVLSFIAKIAVAIFPSSTELAFHVLDEFVAVANTSSKEAEQARISFDVGLFRKLAPHNEAQTHQAAYSLKNPVQRVLSLAAIYQWKAKELANNLLKQNKAR